MADPLSIPYTLTTSGDDVTATLNSSYIIRDGDAYLKIKQLIRKNNGYLSATEIQNS
jgi:hypothetical protein